MQNCKEFYKKSVEDRDAFWKNKRLITWKRILIAFLIIKTLLLPVGSSEELLIFVSMLLIGISKIKRIEALIYISTETGERIHLSADVFEINSCAHAQ